MNNIKTRCFRSFAPAATFLFIMLAFAGISHAQGILNQLHTITMLASTVPSNGDVNPYGVAFVPFTLGNLKAGHILVSNFNNSSNLQGTGTTIVDVGPNGTMTQFAKVNAGSLPGSCPGGVGLTTALAVLHHGWVVVGSLPTKDGTGATAKAGCLIVLDRTGKPVETISGPLINGPWDMTARDTGNAATLFVSNVLNGTVAANGKVTHQGTVVRIELDTAEDVMPRVESMAVVGNGFAERTDPAALVIGPTGLGLNSPGVGKEPTQLYVADSLNNRIVVISDPLHRTTPAGTSTVLIKGNGLQVPLGLVVTPSGHILTVNGNNGVIIELAPSGNPIKVASKWLNNTGGPPPGAGALFGLVYVAKRGVVYVDDSNNTLNQLH